MSLNPKQKRFIEEYLVDLNATQAAIRAGYSEKTAYSQGQRLLKHVEIVPAIEVAIAERSARTKVTADMVIQELAKIGFSDMRKFASWGDGVSFKESSELEDGDAACVAEVAETITKDGGSVRIKLHDKKGALELLGKHLGIFIDKLEISGSVNIIDNIK